MQVVRAARGMLTANPRRVCNRKRTLGAGTPAMRQGAGRKAMTGTVVSGDGPQGQDL